MSIKVEDAVETVVNILLQVGERVVEVSRQQVMTRIWDREDSPLNAFRSQYEGKKISEIRNDSTIAKCKEAIEDAFLNGHNSYTEYISYNNDNTILATFSLRVLACHPDKDYVFLVIENISRGDEQRLVEDKWKLALDASSQGVWDANMEAGTIFFSDKWQQIFGYNAREVGNMADWGAKIFPEDKVIAERKMQDYVEGRVPIYSAEVRYRCKDDSYKWILSRGLIISKKPDGTPLRFIGTHTDISEQKAAEEELREAKETFANSFNYSGIAKALIAPGGKWLEVNDVICELTGYSREELNGMHYNEITFPEDVGIDVPLIEKLIAKEIPSYTIEKRFVSKDRRVLTTTVTVTLVRDNEDRPKYFVCDVLDETNKKAIAKELQRKNQQLESASANLVSKISQLEQLNNIIAHNLRGPVGNIKMLSDGTDLFPPDEAMKMIQTSSLALLEQLEMMVEVARIKLDREVTYDTCNVSELIGNITGQLQGIIYQKHVSIVQQLGINEVRYPKLYLESILYNLINNAIKYRRENIQPVIEITTTETDGKVKLVVKDNGIGIDLEKHGNKMFGLNQTFHQGYDSKGVGLFITKNQIESLGGSITVKSTVNEGCEFTIVL